MRFTQKVNRTYMLPGLPRLNKPIQPIDKISPKHIWEFVNGDYDLMHKWQRRHSRQLAFEDIRHHQKIIVARTETDRIIKEIDKIPFIDQVTPQPRSPAISGAYPGGRMLLFNRFRSAPE